MRLLAIILISVFAFSGCKKGENDPWISLKTRKGRLSGDWKVKFAEYSVNDSTWNFDGATLIKTVDGKEIHRLSVTHEINFTKSGDYTVNKTTLYPENHFSPNTPAITATYLEVGIWNFTGGAGGTKTKSQLVMQPTRIERRIEGLAEVDAEVYDNPLYGKVINLDMLKNKEMRWKYDYKGSTSSETQIEIGTWEFEKK